MAPLSSLAAGAPGWLRRRGALLLALLLALAAASQVAVGLRNLTRAQQQASGWVAHTLEVLAQAAALETDLATAVAEGRGFVAYGTADAQARFDAAVRRVGEGLAAVRALTADNRNPSSGHLRVVGQ